MEWAGWGAGGFQASPLRAHLERAVELLAVGAGRLGAVVVWMIGVGGGGGCRVSRSRRMSACWCVWLADRPRAAQSPTEKLPDPPHEARCRITLRRRALWIDLIASRHGAVPACPGKAYAWVRHRCIAARTWRGQRRQGTGWRSTRCGTPCLLLCQGLRWRTWMGMGHTMRQYGAAAAMYWRSKVGARGAAPRRSETLLGRARIHRPTHRPQRRPRRPVVATQQPVC